MKFNIDDDFIIEPYKKPTIVLIDKSPKGYINQYKLDIVSEYIANQWRYYKRNIIRRFKKT